MARSLWDRRRFGLALGLAALGVGGTAWRELTPRRVAIVVPDRLTRGAWQRPWALRSWVKEQRVRTIVTLTAINRDDPKYVDQKAIVDAMGLDWRLVPMRGSSATLDQLVLAADLVADPARQPVFFHCVGGHHRSNLVQMAFRVRHQGWSVARAWDEVARLPWTQPVAPADQRDRALIAAFAARESGTRSRPQS